jgi:DinB family protein
VIGDTLPAPMGETERRVARMRDAPDEMKSLLTGSSEQELARRPATNAWSVTEIMCHLRDVEEFYFQRVQTILANRDPVLTAFDPDRWAVERQYCRCECLPALEAFRGRRRDTLALLDTLGEEDWERGGSHAQRGWMTVRRIVHGWAKHDDEHTDQIRRALKGQP